jgi:tetratricopeptide (TPR) repeat protein
VTPWEYGVLLYVRGVVYFKLGRVEEGDKHARDCARLFKMSGDSIRYVYARLLVAHLAWARYDFRRARNEYCDILKEIDAAKDELLAARITGYIANCDLDTGNTPAAAPALALVLQTYARFGLLTEVARIRWALARVPLMEGRIVEAIPLLRASKAEFENLNQAMDAALATLDLAEAVLATNGGDAEVRRLCGKLVTTFKIAGMMNEALTAITYLREAGRAGTMTAAKIRHVRRFLERLDGQPALVFRQPAD